MRFLSFVRSVASVASLSVLVHPLALAQTIDCSRLQAQIAQGSGGNRAASAARRQAGELARTQGYAHQLGCDRGFSFFGGTDPQCGGLNQRIQQMQANLAQLQASGGGGREGLVARYNAYCRGQPAEAPRQRGFFESLFGGPEQEPRPGPVPVPEPMRPGLDEEADDDGVHAHGGSQVVCVRTCDGGFFPMGLSARRGGDNLNEMCTALCPGTEAIVYTRNPDADIKTAVGLDGKPYMDLPNALKYQKSVAETCSCHPAGKTWAEALANAEALNEGRKGDILVTQQKSDELSRPNLDAKARATLLKKPATAMATGEDVTKGPPASAIIAEPLPDAAKETPLTVRPPVRQVGPQP